MQTKPRIREAAEDMLSLKSWGERPEYSGIPQEVSVDCGWGRLIFGQTFQEPQALAATLEEETSGERDVALYVHEPQVVLAEAPQSLFLDPSHTFRHYLTGPRAQTPLRTITIRDARADDAAEVNRLYLSRGMVPLREGYLEDDGHPESVTVLVAEGIDGRLAGVVIGIDHRVAINDPDNGSSLWALAVDPQAQMPGVGTALVLALAEHFRKRGRAFMDLSVMHDNEQAIALYEKLGFVRVPVFCVKRKNAVNESLFVGPAPDARAQHLCPDHRRRGAPARHRGGGRGRRGRPVPALLRRPLDLLPGIALRHDQRGGAVALRRQGADEDGCWPRRACACRSRSAPAARTRSRPFSSATAASWSSRRAASRAVRCSSISRPRTR